MKATLHRASLHYGAGLVLHTASSGSVGYLDALYLQLAEGSQTGVGEARINIAYLNGLDAASVLDNARLALTQTDWTLGAQALLADQAEWRTRYLAPVRMMMDSALLDLHAQQLGVSMASLFDPSVNAVDGAATWRSNQTLFWSSDEVMLARAAAYLERGFHELKLRVGIGAFADDLRRIDLLRERFGQRATLSIDANGQWQAADCPARFDALAARGIEYVEQPVAAGDWITLRKLAQESPLTLMLDESLQSQADIDALIELSGLPVAAHLKLVKLGGATATVSAARKLAAAGIDVMIGQMNEGAAATAAALHASMATAPRWAELYGADGLADDPASGLSYHAGCVQTAGRTGLGIVFNIGLTQSL